MESVFNSIRQSLNTENYLAALALALTIPDICGKVEFPNEKVGDRYCEWYTNYVDNAYNFPPPKCNPDDLPIPPRFSASDCYQLRCAILHSWSIDMDFDKVNFDLFKLYKNTSVVSGVRWEQGKPQTAKSYIYLDITRFCQTMCDVAEEYYNTRKADFSKYHIEIQ